VKDVSMAGVMDIREIEAVLPHRYPFLLVDRVDELGDDRIVASKMVSRNEPHFEGHFPGMPVMPGVLIIEALAQAGALYAARLTAFDPRRQVIYFMAIDKAKFRRPVVPGDHLTLVVTPLRKGGVIWKMRGEARVAGQVVAEAEFMASIQNKPTSGGGAPASTGGAAPDTAAAAAADPGDASQSSSDS
jgi:3-hydroxyacyl-[acyl-carrier-protein] dehydratase